MCSNTGCQSLLAICIYLLEVIQQSVYYKTPEGIYLILKLSFNVLEGRWTIMSLGSPVGNEGSEQTGPRMVGCSNSNETHFQHPTEMRSPSS